MPVPRIRTATVLIALGAASLSAPPAAASPPAAPPAPEVKLPATFNPAASLAPLVKAVEPAVVAIEVEGLRSGPGMGELPPGFRDFFGPFLQEMDPGPRMVRGEGSGFVISPDGLLVTNHHVVDGASTVRARFAGGELVEATLIGSDPRTDLALLQLPADRTWAYVELGDSEALQVGDWVVAIGNPLGLGITVTAGIISGKGRNLGSNPYDEFIQTDAAINQGNSGGPLFDLSGRVVGVNSAIIKYANTVGFSIPSDLVRRVIADLREGGVVRRGFIGVGLQDPDPDLARALGLDKARGALVTFVQPDTPAERAGLRSGDVLTAVEGAAVADSASLIRLIGRHKPGEKVRVDVWRDGRARTMRLELAARPDEAASAPPAGRPAPPVREPAPTTVDLGFRVRPAVAADTDSSAVEVTWVDPAGPARGRLVPGDRILSVHRQPVSSPAELAEAIRAGGDPVLLEVIRAGGRRYVAIKRP